MSRRPEGEELLQELEAGRVRAASPDGGGEGAKGWTVHAWVKRAILDLFPHSPVVAMTVEGEDPQDASPYWDKRVLPIRRFQQSDAVRIVPGGSAVRRGAYLGSGVVCMPPMYVNVGAHVESGSMLDSHALVGSCAQIGAGVHLSAAAQIGGVLEPAGARPVIIEDGAFVGGGAGVYDGVLVGRGAVLGAGVILTATTPLYDLVEQRVIRGTREAPLEVPRDAVVVPGTRAVPGSWAQEHGLGMACALIAKYRDARTDAATALEGALRERH